MICLVLKLKEADNKDGGPARGGEFIMAFSPQLIAGDGWNEHAEKFFEQNGVYGWCSLTWTTST